MGEVQSPDTSAETSGCPGAYLGGWVDVGPTPGHAIRQSIACMCNTHTWSGIAHTEKLQYCSIAVSQYCSFSEKPSIASVSADTCASMRRPDVFFQ